MARSYSAVMALIGMVVVVLRGLKDNAGIDGTVAAGLCWMVVLGTTGLIVGYIAQQTVDESVRTKIEAELASVTKGEPTTEAT